MKHIPRIAPFLIGGILIIFPVFFAINLYKSHYEEEMIEIPLSKVSSSFIRHDYILNIIVTVFLSVIFNSRRLLKIGMI